MRLIFARRVMIAVCFEDRAQNVGLWCCWVDFLLFFFPTVESVAEVSVPLVLLININMCFTFFIFADLHRP